MLHIALCMLNELLVFGSLTGSESCNEYRKFIRYIQLCCLGSTVHLSGQLEVKSFVTCANWLWVPNTGKYFLPQK